jgi:hypothetical protein
MASPTLSGAVVLKDHDLGPFTGFPLSTIITALNISLDSVYCLAKIKIA